MSRLTRTLLYVCSVGLVGCVTVKNPLTSTKTIATMPATLTAPSDVKQAAHHQLASPGSLASESKPFESPREELPPPRAIKLTLESQVAELTSEFVVR